MGSRYMTPPPSTSLGYTNQGQGGGVGGFLKNNWSEILGALAMGLGIYQQGQDRSYSRELSEADRAMLEADRSAANAEWKQRAPYRQAWWENVSKPVDIADRSNPLYSSPTTQAPPQQPDARRFRRIP